MFARLLELIQSLRRDDTDGGAGLHRLLMDLLYEMSRIQRVKIEDLGMLVTLECRCLGKWIADMVSSVYSACG